jgi:TetR/AcrR family transcriptional repressor of nem operon
MGRSSRKQAEENRLRIVKAATGLFITRGIEPVGIADIMKAAGMTQGGFYRHFASKEGLAAEACGYAFERSVEIWGQVAKDAVEKNHDPLEAVISFYLSPKPAILTCPMVVFAADAAPRSADDPLRAAYDNGVRTLFEAFANFAGPRKPAGLSRDVRTLFAAMVGSNVLARSSHDQSWSVSPKADVAANKRSRKTRR